MTNTGRQWRLRAVVALIILAVMGGSLALSRYTRIRTDDGPDRARRVVLFAVPGLALDDLDADVLPNLDRMAESGAIAVANIRTQSDEPNLVGAYATLGAGNRTEGTTADVVAFPADAPWGTSTIREVMERRVDTEIDGDVLLPLLDPVLDAVGPDGGSGPGALGDALAEAGKTTAVVSNASAAPNPAPGRSAPAALGVSTSDGVVGTGSVDDDLLTVATDADGTERVVADIDAYVAAVVRAQESADLVIVDSGDTTRAQIEADAGTDTEEIGEGPPLSTTTVVPTETDESILDADELRLQALQRTDRLLGALRSELRPGTLLLVVGVTPPGSSWALTPVVAVGPGVPKGYLESTSTHRPALVTLTDVAPTVLDRLGVDVPSAMIGQPMRYRSSDASWSEARRLDDLLESRASADRVMTITFIGLQIALYGSACLFLLRRRNVPTQLRAPMETVALACGAWPAATFLLRIGTSLYSMGMGTYALSWVLAFAVALAARRLRGHPLDPVIAVSGLTVATIVADLATGAHLQVGSFFGYTPHTAPRFVGLGNSGFAILAGSTVALVAGLMARSRDRASTWWLGAGIVLLVVVADGAPWMGADVGGILALVPVLGLMLWALRGNKIRWTTLALAAVAGLAFLGLAVGFEALRDPADRTHVGRFFLGAGEGSNLTDTLRRKWNANTDTLRSSLLPWLIPVLAGVGIYTGRRSSTVRRVLPQGSPERIGVVATLAVGIAGWLVNDSGIMIAALACVQLGPYLLLLIFRAGPVEPDEHVPTARNEGEAEGERGTSDTVASRMSVTKASVEADHRPGSSEVVAIVPAKDRADSVADTVHALLAVPRVDRVLVVDDGSTDDTMVQAAAAGADVLRLPVNRGKGGAVLAGVDHTPNADVYLLIDADLARTAAAADRLLGPVLADEADLTIGVLPPAAGRGGFGAIKNLSAKGIERACGLTVQAPLSGQRAIKADLLRGLQSAERFGLEVAMTIDVARGGGRVLEVDVPMDHRHTGRSLSGFAHRGRQGLDIVRSLWPRIVPRSVRIGGLVATVLVFIAVSIVSARAVVPESAPPARPADRVLIFGIPGLGVDHLTDPDLPNLQRLATDGAYGLASPRTGAQRTSADAYATIGAGDRVAAGTSSVAAAPSSAQLAGGTARQVGELRTGEAVDGSVVVTNMASTRRGSSDSTNSRAGALGDALHAAGYRTGVVANSSITAQPDVPGGPVDEYLLDVPASLAVADSSGSIDAGDVSGTLLRSDPSLPFGVGVDEERFVAEVLSTMDESEVTVADPGEIDRALAYSALMLEAPATSTVADAMVRTDRMLGAVADQLPPDTQLIITGITPPSGGKLVPLVVVDDALPGGRITSPSTRRSDLVTFTDVAPTALEALGVEVPDNMIGQAIQYEKGRPTQGDLVRQEDLIVGRDQVYGGLINTFAKVIIALYLVAGVVIVKGVGGPRSRWVLRYATLTTATWPISTFLLRAVPPLHGLGTVSHLLVWMTAAAIAGLAITRRGQPLDPLFWVSAFTFTVLTLDLATGGHLQVSSYLGYTPSVAARFVGMGNAASGVYIGATILTAALLVVRSGGRTGAWWSAVAVAVVAVIVNGAPWLGADVGGIITLVPATGLVLLALAGYPLTWRRVAAVAALTVVVLGVAVGIEALRPAADRTHIGTFFLGGDQNEVWTTVARKWEVNVRLLTSSTWRWFIGIIGGFAVVVLATTKRWRVAAPAASPQRAAIVGLSSAALLGGITNDSGALVATFVLCFLGPLLVFLSLYRPPIFIPAGAPFDDPGPAA